ncbi:Zeta toxin family protein [bacterium]|nr:Zeta toxin family protein [bacterium]
MTGDRRILIVAGPNGAGKTTFATEFLPREAACPNFINADLIAAGLSPFHLESAAIMAGRLALQEMARHVAKGESFSFETTLSGKRYARLIPEWQSAGYRVELFYLLLANVDIALSRVRSRVARGGHNVPESDIRRRFDRGWHNFQEIYKPLVNYWRLYDASGISPVLIEEGKSR